MDKFALYSDACEHIINRLLKRKVDLSVRHIVLTQKPYTLFFEKQLSKNGGFFDIEVLSLSRLYYKLGGKPLLPDESAVMQLKRILKSTPLKCFNKSKGFKGFSHKMLETIKGLANSGIEPNDLSDTNPKLADIKTIYQEYIKHNPNSMAQDMLSLINGCGFFTNAHVYVVNFANPNVLEQRIFDMIKSLALSFTCTHVDSAQNQLAMPKMEIYSALNRAEQLKAAARRIKKAAREGVALSEMCIVCAPESYETARRILQEYEIDYYCDKRRKLDSSPLSQYVLLALKGNLSRHECLKLAKNPYLNVGVAECAKFENYCFKYNIEYGLHRPFELGQLAERDAPERVRKATAAHLMRFRANATVEDLRGFIESIRPAEGDEAAKARLIEILSLLKNDDNDFKDLFVETAESAFLKPLPLGEGISVSNAASSRGKRFKLAFILDFNEGVMPFNSAALGVLNAKESAALKLSPSLEHLNCRNRDDLTELIYSSKSVFVAYIRSPSLRPSPLIYKLKHSANNLTEITSANEYELVLSSNKIDLLADYAACKRGGLEQLLLSANRPNVFSSSLYPLLKNEADKLLMQADYAPKTVNGEIFNLTTISSSRLQTYFDCPYKHFVRHGLRAKENEKGGMTPLDTGLLVHRAAEEFFLSGFNEPSLNQIIENAIEDFAHKLEEKTAIRLANEIRQLCLHLKSNLASGSFAPLGAEIKLADPRFKPVLIDGATLVGSIDYADCHNDYVRVIDYKSGLNVSYESKSLYYGLKLQLPLYMHALNQSGYKSAAMFYYPFRLKWNSAHYPFIGVFNNSLSVVCAMDNDLQNNDQSNVIPAYIKHFKDGPKVFGTNGKTEQEFKKITEYAFNISTLAVQQMRKGCIRPLPYKSSTKTSCRNCAYKIACGFCGSYRILRAQKKQEAGKSDE